MKAGRSGGDSHHLTAGSRDHWSIITEVEVGAHRLVTPGDLNFKNERANRRRRNTLISIGGLILDPHGRETGTIFLIWDIVHKNGREWGLRINHRFERIRTGDLRFIRNDLMRGDHHSIISRDAPHLIRDPGFPPRNPVAPCGPSHLIPDQITTRGDQSHRQGVPLLQLWEAKREGGMSTTHDPNVHQPPSHSPSHLNSSSLRVPRIVKITLAPRTSVGRGVLFVQCTLHLSTNLHNILHRSEMLKNLTAFRAPLKIYVMDLLLLVSTTMGLPHPLNFVTAPHVIVRLITLPTCTTDHQTFSRRIVTAPRKFVMEPLIICCVMAPRNIFVMGPHSTA